MTDPRIQESLRHSLATLLPGGTGSIFRDTWGEGGPWVKFSLPSKLALTGFYDLSRNVHELPVDAFVYENCSTNVDTMTEFCTGVKNQRLPFSLLLFQGTPITRGKMAEYNFNPDRGTDSNTLNANNTFNRTLVHPRMYHPEDEFWNGNSTIIR